MKNKQLESFFLSFKKQEISITYQENVITYNPNIQLSVLLNIAKQVTDFVFSDSDEYLPELKKIGLYYFVIKHMTNIPVPDKENNQMYVFDYIFKILTSGLGVELTKLLAEDATFNCLSSAVEEKIKYKTNMKISNNDTIDNFFTNIQLLINSINEFAQTVTKKFKDYTDVMPKSTFKKVIKNLSNSKFDEKN